MRFQKENKYAKQVDKMKYHVAGHTSHSKKGKLEHVIGHEVMENPAIHRRHKRRLGREIKALEKQKAR